MGVFDGQRDEDGNRSIVSNDDFGINESIRGDYGGFNNNEAIKSKDYNPQLLDSAENSATSSNKSSENEILSKENQPFVNNVTGRKDDKGGSWSTRNKKSNSSSIKGKFRTKKAAIAAAIVGGGASALIGAFSMLVTGVMPIHVMQIVTEKINSTASSLEYRTDAIFNSKIKKSVRCGAIKAMCKFEAISDKQLAKLEKAGFKVEVDVDNPTITGKKRITSLSHPDIKNGVKIDSDNLTFMMKNDVNLRSNLNKAYQGKFASFRDNIAKKFKSIFKVRGVSGEENNKAPEKISEDTVKETNSTGETPSSKSQSSDSEDEDIKNKSEETKKKGEEFFEESKKIANEADVDTDVGIKAKNSKIKDLLGKTGVAQLPCLAYSIGNFFYSGVKTVRAVKLATFAMKFLSMASKIKAGHASPNEVTSIGNQLAGLGKAKITAATDSQGYRALAYNDSIGNLDKSASKYSNGALGWIAKTFAQFRRGARNSGFSIGCKILQNDAVDFAITFLTGGLLAAVADFALGLVVSEVISTVLKDLPELIAGVVVKKGITGEDYGNAIMSGSGSLMSKNTITGGSGALDKTQALAFYQQNETRIARIAEDERATLSPFDISSRHTFFGSIISSAIPYNQQLATIGGFIPSIASIASRSLSSILPSASAADAAGFKANMEICQDADIIDIGVATDPFCNPYTGVSTQTNTKSMDEVIDFLVAEGSLDSNKGENNPLDAIIPGSGLDKYKKHCYERGSSLGVGETLDEMGLGCVQKDDIKTAYYSSFMTSVRAQDGMDDDLTPSNNSGGGSSSGSTNSALSGKGDFFWPVEKSKVTGQTEYGPSSVPLHQGWHTGLDIWANIGTPLHAIADGEVTMAAPSVGCGPAQIEIKHANNIYSVYCHNQSGSVKVGDKVKKGQQIGTVGDEGYAKGTVSHVHLEITEGQPIWSDWKAGRKNPKDYIGDL